MKELFAVMESHRDDININLRGKYYFHKSSNSTTLPFPCWRSSCPCFMISTIAGEDMRYSVSSIGRLVLTIVFFWEAIRFSDLTAFS